MDEANQARACGHVRATGVCPLGHPLYLPVFQTFHDPILFVTCHQGTLIFIFVYLFAYLFGYGHITCRVLGP